MLLIACCDILCAILLSVINVYMFMSVFLKAHKSLCCLLRNMLTLKEYCIQYCIVVLNFGNKYTISIYNVFFISSVQKFPYSL